MDLGTCHLLYHTVIMLVICLQLLQDQSVFAQMVSHNHTPGAIDYSQSGVHVSGSASRQPKENAHILETALCPLFLLSFVNTSDLAN